jgi:hypothetical protein
LDNATGVAANNPLVGESLPALQTIQTSTPEVSGYSEQNLKKNTISKAHVEGGGGLGSSTLKNETVSGKAFALQDKVIFILNSSKSLNDFVKWCTLNMCFQYMNLALLKLDFQLCSSVFFCI